METKFSKNWRSDDILESSPDKPFVIVANRNDVNSGICPIVYVMPAYAKNSDWKNPIISEESKANLNLILSSPDMFNALFDLYNDRETWSDLFEPQQELICRALNKATGSDFFKHYP